MPRVSFNMKRGSIVNDLGRVPGRLVLDDDDDEVPSIRRKMRLSNRNLTTVPKIAISTESLVLLDLSKNQLTILPNDITFESEHSVKQVFLQNNMLVSIPPEICRCQVLEDLRVSRNQLPHLPPALGKIHALIRLDASGNRISHTPPSLSQLMNLRVLNLSDNRIEHLDSMDILPLTGLTELSVAKNKLSEIPLAVAVLQHLRYLRLSHNKITELDSDMLRLPSLLELHLSDNLLRLLPERGWSQATNLDTLDLAGNVLTHVPRGLGLLTNLTVLGLTRNETLPKVEIYFRQHITHWCIRICRMRLNFSGYSACQTCNLVTCGVGAGSHRNVSAGRRSCAQVYSAKKVVHRTSTTLERRPRECLRGYTTWSGASTLFKLWVKSEVGQLFFGATSWCAWTAVRKEFDVCVAVCYVEAGRGRRSRREHCICAHWTDAFAQ